jgi:hypothetical protein
MNNSRNEIGELNTSIMGMGAVLFRPYQCRISVFGEPDFRLELVGHAVPALYFNAALIAARKIAP